MSHMQNIAEVQKQNQSENSEEFPEPKVSESQVKNRQVSETSRISPQFRAGEVSENVGGAG